MEAGWNAEARQIGAINQVKIREVQGFMYYQMSLGETSQEFEEMAATNEEY
jgi:hypothetical protein